MKCKNCKYEYEKNVKFCPNCGLKQKKGKMGIIIAIVIFLFIIIAIFGSDSEENMSSNENTNSSSQENNVNNNDSNDNSSNNSSNKSKFSYEIMDYKHDTFSYYIEGKVTNNRNKNYSYVQIEFICYDSDGNNLGTAIDNTNNLLANQSWKFKAIFLGNSSEVDHCDYHEITGW